MRHKLYTPGIICVSGILIILHLSCLHAFAFILGEKAPPFALKDMSGKDVRLDDLRGKIVFINFWASWCAPCKKELPLLDALQRARDKEMVILAVNIDKRRVNTDNFLKRHPLTLKVLFDPDGNVVASYGARAMPTSFILDREGIVRYIHFGFDEKKDPLLWDREIDELAGGMK